MFCRNYIADLNLRGAVAHLKAVMAHSHQYYFNFGAKYPWVGFSLAEV